jgi:hypothetical protein
VGVCTRAGGSHNYLVSVQEGLQLHEQDSYVPWKLSPTAPKDCIPIPLLTVLRL